LQLAVGDPAVDDACEPVESSLTCDQAIVVVEPYFLAVQEIFIAHEMAERGSSKMRKTRIECSIDAHDTARHFAGCDDTGRLIVVAPELVELPEETVLGILAHEFGHAMDFAYPGEFAIDHDGALVRATAVMALAANDARGAQARSARMRQWQDRDEDTVERTADVIAGFVTGHHIGYTGPCRLQTLDRGQDRPAGLR
jgi:hypothetical protein